jgi:hypothetical protein
MPTSRALPVASREGLHAAFCFPVLLRGDVQSVMEFFSREIRKPDDQLLSMLGAVAIRSASTSIGGARRTSWTISSGCRSTCSASPASTDISSA